MVLHKNKWDRKATRAYERKLRAKVEAGGTNNAAGPAKVHGAKKDVVSGPAGPQNTTIPEDGLEKKNESGTSPEDKDDDAGGQKSGDDQEQSGGKYSRRKIVSNAWRYEEPEEDPYLKDETETVEEPEPDYARMTVGKAQLKFSDDEDETGDIDRLLVTDKGLPSKGKVIQADRRQFQDINEKITKQNAAEAFRQRFAPRKSKASAGVNNLGGGSIRDDVDDIDEFLGGLKLEVRTPAQHELTKTRMPLVGGLTQDKRSEEEDEKWLDDMLESGSRGSASRYR
ncbi:hypothetical protein BDZ91DRAFT_790342 [Kalaharituber pfeilii]|nr:hypothetical protein BDZ91DRAFT_790342 [Kalaharituber pfeilii]